MMTTYHFRDVEGDPVPGVRLPHGVRHHQLHLLQGDPLVQRSARRQIRGSPELGAQDLV